MITGGASSSRLGLGGEGREWRGGEREGRGGGGEREGERRGRGEGGE